MRVECKSIDGRFTFAYGVDHVTSVFFQVFDNKKDEDNEVVVSADNLGVNLYDDSDFTERQKREIAELQKAFASKREKCPYPNIDAERLFNIARAFDIHISKARIYEVLD